MNKIIKNYFGVSRIQNNHIENVEYNYMIEMGQKILKEIDRNPLQPLLQSYEDAIMQQNDYVPNDVRPLNIKLKRVPLHIKI